MKELFEAIKRFFRDRFSLDEDKAEESIIVESIQRGVVFKGTNLWTLIFAILIASIGLNVNSTAVIIGAMLISPLMGPIMGIGLGIGILDFDLMKRGIRNLAIASILSILTSFLYFYLSPLHEARSEILARTTPAIWDVLIAFFGGMAGIVAGTRREKSNVLPGVAIATALMPPLCTAGFGLATGVWYYFLGALYLFFINSLFICLSTFVIVRFLKFKTVRFATPQQHKKVVRYIWVISMLTVLPSIYFAFRIVQQAIFEQNARRFVQHEFHFNRTQVVHQAYKFDNMKPAIELLLIGEELDSATIRHLKSKMPRYHLDSSILVIHQGLDAKKEIDIAQIRASILEDVFNSQPTGDTSKKKENILETPVPDLRPEMAVLYPDLKEYTLGHVVNLRVNPAGSDTITQFVGVFKQYLSQQEREKLANWLKKRLGLDSVSVVVRIGTGK